MKGPVVAVPRACGWPGAFNGSGIGSNRITAEVIITFTYGCGFASRVADIPWRGVWCLGYACRVRETETTFSWGGRMLDRQPFLLSCVILLAASVAHADPMTFRFELRVQGSVGTDLLFGSLVPAGSTILGSWTFDRTVPDHDPENDHHGGYLDPQSEVLLSVADGRSLRLVGEGQLEVQVADPPNISPVDGVHLSRAHTTPSSVVM